MGSKEIWKLEYRQGFVFIGITGKYTALEKRAQKKQDSVTLVEHFWFYNNFTGQDVSNIKLAEKCRNSIKSIALQSFKELEQSPMFSVISLKGCLMLISAFIMTRLAKWQSQKYGYGTPKVPKVKNPQK